MGLTMGPGKGFNMPTRSNSNIPTRSNAPSIGSHSPGIPVDTVPQAGMAPFHTGILTLPTLNNGPAQAPNGVGSEMNPSTANLDEGVVLQLGATPDSNGTSSTTPASTVPTAGVSTSAPALSVSNIWGGAMLLIVALIFVGLFNSKA
jgi:hypothetical protein